jgi:hypothetical protein
MQWAFMAFMKVQSKQSGGSWKNWQLKEFNQSMGRSEAKNNTSNLSANKIVTNL